MVFEGMCIMTNNVPQLAQSKEPAAHGNKTNAVWRTDLQNAVVWKAARRIYGKREKGFDGAKPSRKQSGAGAPQSKEPVAQERKITPSVARTIVSKAALRLENKATQVMPEGFHN